MFSLLFSNNVFSQTVNKAREHIEAVTLSKIHVVPNDFSVCLRYGCKEIQNVSLDENVWSSLSQELNDKSKSAQLERALIAEYIGKMETVVGRITNTQYDTAGTFLLFLNPVKAKGNQMDCIDESINSFSYLKLLENEGKLHFHRIIGLVTRGGLVAGYPHTAVLIAEHHSSNKYVVDSWFLDNGRPATVVPYKVWKSGWKPK